MKTIVITGANSGIGFESARNLARENHIIAVCRNRQKAEAALAEIRAQLPNAHLDLVIADLGDLNSVVAAAQTIASLTPQVDVLLNNAGFFESQTHYTDGIESTFYASHLGHMLLTIKLLPLLSKSNDARVVCVSSMAHTAGDASRFFTQPEKYSSMQTYADAKFANLLFVKALAKNYADILTAYSLHPGVVRTGFFSQFKGVLKKLIDWVSPLFFITAEQGAQTSIYLCTAPIDTLKPLSGSYFAKKQPQKSPNRGATQANADALWDKSMQFLKAWL